MAHGQNARKNGTQKEICSRRANGRFSYTNKCKWVKKYTHRLERLMAKRELRDAENIS